MKTPYNTIRVYLKTFVIANRVNSTVSAITKYLSYEADELCSFILTPRISNKYYKRVIIVKNYAKVKMHVKVIVQINRFNVF